MRIYTGAYFPDFKSRIIASNVTVAFFSAIIIYIIRCKIRKIQYLCIR